jgi:hypothetical protein
MSGSEALIDSRYPDGMTPVFLFAHDYATHHNYCEIVQNGASDNCTCGLKEALELALASERGE